MIKRPSIANQRNDQRVEKSNENGCRVGTTYDLKHFGLNKEMTVLHAEFRQSATNRWEAIQNEYRHFKIHDKKNLFVINRLHLLQQNEQKERYMLVFLLFGPSIFYFH